MTDYPHPIMFCRTKLTGLLVLTGLFLLINSSLAKEIDFTSPTYAIGALGGQDSWFGSAGSITLIDNIRAVSLDKNSTFSTSMYYDADLPSSDDVYTFSVDFYLVIGSALPGSTINMIRLQYGENNTPSSFDSGIFLTRNYSNGNEQYRIARAGDGFVTGEFFSDSQIGLDRAGGDFTSDFLRMTYSITRGASASEWTYTASIVNRTYSNTVLSTFSGSLNVDQNFHDGSLIDVGINNMQLGNAGSEISTVAVVQASINSYEQKTSPAVGPNIVLLYADDLGYMDTSVYGSTYHQTPNIDKLANDGMRFTQAYSVAPLCAPSRISMFSGRYGVRNDTYEVTPGVFMTAGQDEDVPMYGPENNLMLPTNTPTLAQILKAGGYRCGYIGKWHMGPRSDITVHGFEEFVEMITNNADTHFDASVAIRSKSSGYPEASGYSSDYITECALHFLDSSDPSPFFLYVPYTHVHTPIEPKPYLNAKYSGLPTSTYQRRSAYAAMVESLDNSVGKIMDRLESLDLLDNTVVIFTSDNGGLYSVGGFGDGTYGVNFPLRDAKATLWEGGIRVPMTISHGGVVGSGLVTDAVVSQLDMLPTILEIAGLSDQLAPVLPDGYSIMPVLNDENFEFPDRELYFHHPGYRNRMVPSSAIRYGDWKLIEDLEDGSVTLYDLANDLSETTNESTNRPDIAQGLLSKLYAWREDTGAAMPVYMQRFDSGQLYTNTELTGQKNWSGDVGFYTVADVANDGRLDITTTEGSKRVNFDDANLLVDNAAYTLTVPFSFSRSPAAVTNQDILGVDFNPDGDNATYNGIRGYLRRVSDTTYSLGFSSSVAGQVESGTTFGESDIGLGSSDSTSDELELCFNIIRGADEDDWSYEITLVNLDRDTVVSTLSGSARQSLASLYNSGLDVGLSTMTAHQASISNLRVYDVAFIHTPYPAERGYPVWAKIKELSLTALGDDDGDQYYNLMEYALGGDPNDSSDVGTIPQFRHDADLGLFSFSHVELNASDSGVIYSVEQSPSLTAESWIDTGLSVTTTSATEDPRFELMEYSFPINHADQMFYRLNVVTNP